MVEYIYLVDIAVCRGSLRANKIVGILREGGVQGQAGPVHQVEEVAVVRPVVQQRQRLRLGERLDMHQRQS